MLTWTADSEKQMSRCNKQMLSMLYRLNKYAMAYSDLRQCLGSCMHVEFLDAALKLPKACQLEHDTHGNPASEIWFEIEDKDYDNRCCTGQELLQACTRILCTKACTLIRSRSLEDSQRGVQAQFVEHQQTFSALAPPPGDVSANKVPVIDGMHTTKVVRSIVSLQPRTSAAYS